MMIIKITTSFKIIVIELNVVDSSVNTIIFNLILNDLYTSITFDEW